MIDNCRKIALFVQIATLYQFREYNAKLNTNACQGRENNAVSKTKFGFGSIGVREAALGVYWDATGILLLDLQETGDDSYLKAYVHVKDDIGSNLVLNIAYIRLFQLIF
jgi:hypothetical protein